MPFAWARRLALGGLVFAGACRASSDVAATSSVVDAGASQGATNVITVDCAPTAQALFACDHVSCAASGVCAPPAQSVPLLVTGPIGTTAVRLEGTYADASLNQNDVDVGGAGSVTLHTSSVPATFRVLAQNGADANETGSVAVAVSQTGFATFKALPDYEGVRTVSALLATASVGTTCSVLTASPPADGAPWENGPPGATIALSVPAGQPFAVDVRAGHYAYGCADVTALQANQAVTETIDVYDLPVALSQTDLDVTFSYASSADAGTDAGTGPWKAVADSAGSRLTDAFFASQDQAGALLDAVRAGLPSAADQTQFDSLRDEDDWDQVATAWLSAHAPSIHDRAAAWVTATDAVAPGPLSGHLGAGSAASTGVLTPESFGSLSAAAAGIETPSPFVWTADPDDTVHLQGAIDLASTPLIAHLADSLAATGTPQATDVPSAIGIAIDLTDLATALVGNGVMYGQCTASCATSAMRAALSTAWTAAAQPAASNADDVHFTFTASGLATVGDAAQPVSFSGGWVGQTSGAGVPTSFASKGVVTGSPAVSVP